MRILGKVKEKGYSMVPLKMYFKGSLVKVEVALVKGKQNYDKKDSILKRTWNVTNSVQSRNTAKGRL